jgi:hypothetical protein
MRRTTVEMLAANTLRTIERRKPIEVWGGRIGARRAGVSLIRELAEHNDALFGSSESA